MSGRGRGRGRGRGAPPSGAKLFLMRSAQESGLDDKNFKVLNDITKPALFPPLVWNYEDGSGEVRARQSSTVYLINKGREIDNRIQTSPFWVRPSQTQVDVVRYQSDKRSHRFAQMPSDLAVAEQIGKNLCMDESYMPAELVPTSMLTNASLNKKRALAGALSAENPAKKKPTLEELEKREIQRKIEESKRANVLEEEDGDGNFSDTPPEDEEEEVEDYTMNYYESENESDGGDDAEATF